MNKTFYIFIYTIFIAFPALAQFEVSAEFRPRFELNNGYVMVPTDTSDVTAYVTQRTRLNISYKQEKYSLYLSLQDVRNWGDENIATGTGAFLRSGSSGIHQAWMQFKAGENSHLKIGRQAFIYDDQRLLAGRNWNQYGQTYDAILFSTNKNKWTIDLAISYNNDAAKGGSAAFGLNNFNVDPLNRRLRTLNFIYIKNQINSDWYVSATGLVTGYQKDKTTNTTYLLATYGAYSKFKKGGFEAQGNIFGQAGKSQTGKDVQAFMVTAEASYRTGKIKPGIGIDILSGQDASNTDQDYQSKYHTFDIFYGVRFMRYGFMNQYVVPSNTLNGGWIDIYPNLHLFPNAKNRITIDYHLFSLQQAVAKPNSPGEFLEGTLGSELDIVWHHQFSKELSSSIGFTYYFTNDTFAFIKKIDPAHIGTPYFGWVMLTFKPTLFTN